MSAMIDDIKALVEAGDYRRAAAAYEERGMLAYAQQLYERLFDYGEAGRLAEAQGDHIGAIELFLKGNELEAAESVRRRLMAELSDDIKDALELFEQRSYFLQAAELAESIGNFAQAARLYTEGSSFKKAGKLYERIGRFREAGEAYESFLRGTPDDPVANLGLGRVLQRFGRHRESIPLLSKAMGDVKTSDEASRRIGYGFFKLNLVEAGRSALAKVGIPRTIDPERFMRPFEEEMLQEGADEGAGGAALQGRYRMEGPLPERLGVCYLGRDLLRDKPVVLRFLTGTPEDNAEYYDELRRIQDPPLPGCVRVLEINPEAGFVATEFYDATTLLAMLESESPPNAQRCKAMALQVFDTVRMAHQRGILHGSISPRSILVSSGDVCRVADWALGHLERRMATQTGGPESAFAYRAPELNIGRAGDFSSDLYAIAALLYRCLVGRAPHMNRGAEGLADWPEPFGRFFARALSSEPSRRHASHDLFRRELASLPWFQVADRTVEPLLRKADARESAAGPRFEMEGELAEGRAIDAHDTLLERPVRLLKLPPAGERSVALVNHLHALASPECPSFQDVLRYDDETGALVLEVVTGLPFAEWVEERGPLPPLVLLDAAESLLRALAAVHAGGVGLDTIDPDRVLFDGAGFRATIEKPLVTSDADDATDIANDAVGFWTLLHVGISGRRATGDVTPARVLQLLRAKGHLADRDFHALEAAIPANPTSLAGADEWYADLVRTLEGHQMRRAIFDRMVGLAKADRVLNEQEQRYLEERRAELGLGE